MFLEIPLPIYSQLSNCCGLSTFLMLINPEKNHDFKRFLRKLYSRIKFLLSQTKEEYKWSVALDYILLKTVGDNILSDYILYKFPISFENYRIILKYQLESKLRKAWKKSNKDSSEFNHEFINENLVTSDVLSKSLYSMRTNEELKNYFCLFGGGYYPQKQVNSDGTGALYFTKNDYKNPNKFNIKLNILKNHLKYREHNCIALNTGLHWVAVSSIQGKILHLNDPLSASTRKVNIEQQSPESYRFYLYYYNPKKAIILKDQVFEFLENEIIKEIDLKVKELNKEPVSESDKEVKNENKEINDATDSQPLVK